MNKKEFIDGNFSIDKYGKIVDEYGNEHRNEEGRTETLEE